MTTDKEVVYTYSVPKALGLNESIEWLRGQNDYLIKYNNYSPEKAPCFIEYPKFEKAMQVITELERRLEQQNLLDPNMPTQELRLHMGELKTNEVLVARAAIEWANSRIAALNG